MFSWKKKLTALGAILLIGIASFVVYNPTMAQDILEWPGNMILRPNGPQIIFDGNLQFKGKTSGSVIWTFLNSGGYSQIQSFTTNLTPTSMVRSPQGAIATSTQTFGGGFVGLTAADTILVDPGLGGYTSLCAPNPLASRSGNGIVMTFMMYTDLNCIPPAGVYRIYAIRTL